MKVRVSCESEVAWQSRLVSSVLVLLKIVKRRVWYGKEEEPVVAKGAKFDKSGVKL